MLIAPKMKRLKTPLTVTPELRNILGTHFIVPKHWNKNQIDKYLKDYEKEVKHS